MAATALLKLEGFTNEPSYVDIAQEVIAQMQQIMSQHPLGFGLWLQSLAYIISSPREIAIVGDPDAAETQALLDVVCSGYRPFQVTALGTPSAQASAVPLLYTRGLVEGKATAYVRREVACQAPVTDPQALKALVDG